MAGREKQGIAAELERRRFLSIDRLHDGHSTKAVAEFLGVHVRTAQKWKARHEQQRATPARPLGDSLVSPVSRTGELANRFIDLH